MIFQECPCPRNTQVYNIYDCMQILEILMLLEILIGLLDNFMAAIEFFAYGIRPKPKSIFMLLFP